MSDNLQQYITKNAADYARCIDDDRLRMAELLPWSLPLQDHDLVDYRDGLEAGIVFANSRGMLSDRVSALRDANIMSGNPTPYPWTTFDHIERRLNGTERDLVSWWPRILQDGDTSIYATGRYFDLYENCGRGGQAERANGGLRQFAYRHTAGAAVIDVRGRCTYHR